MEPAAPRPDAFAWIPGLILAVIAIILLWAFLFPEVCKSVPVQLPGSTFDFCWFFG